METRKKFANSTVVKDIVKLLFIVYCLLFIVFLGEKCYIQWWGSN